MLQLPAPHLHEENILYSMGQVLNDVSKHKTQCIFPTSPVWNQTWTHLSKDQCLQSVWKKINQSANFGTDHPIHSSRQRTNRDVAQKESFGDLFQHGNQRWQLSPEPDVYYVPKNTVKMQATKVSSIAQRLLCEWVCEQPTPYICIYMCFAEITTS